MTNSPILFDRDALLRNRTRVRDDALFVHRAALDEVQDRLSLVNRTFNSVGIVSPFPDIWRGAFPDARIVTDDDILDLAPGEFDLVVHAMCLHWANDPVGQIIQSRRALVNDGLFLGLLLGGGTLNELRTTLAEAETRTTGGLSPRVAPMSEIRELGAVLQRSGLNLPVVDSFEMVAEYRDLMHLMHDLRAMGETNALAARIRHPSTRALFATAQRIYAAHFPAQTEGRLKASFEIMCLTGWVPDDSQPKPLRPGSAASRLAEALGTRETPLRD